MEELQHPTPEGREKWTDFRPIIRQSSYHSRDVAGLLMGVESLDMSHLFLLLKPIPESYLACLEASLDVELCLAGCEGGSSVAALRRADFCSVPFRVENVIIATSLSLWSTTLKSNEIVEATRNRFLGSMESKRRAKKNKLPLRPFFLFLNEMGIDVVVMSSCKGHVNVFCAKRASERCSNALEGKAGNSGRKRRTLVALEFGIDDGLWSPMKLSVVLLPRCVKASAQDGNVRAACVASASNSIKHMTVGADVFECSNTLNADVRMLDRTVYNPQMVCVKKIGSGQVFDEQRSEEEEATPKDSPFSGMKYPNINQLDFQVTEVLRRGLHPVLKRNRIRFLLSFPVALVGLVLALTLVVHVKSSLQPCFYGVSVGDCVHDTSDSSSDSESDSICNTVHNMVLLQAVNVFLFGGVGSPGRFVVATGSCMFLVSLLAATVNYLTTRTLAREKSQPFFYMVMMALHILLSSAACAFSAYALYVFSHAEHVIHCSSFDTSDAAACMAAQKLCPEFVIEVRAHHSLRVTLALSVVLLVSCLVELLAAMVPPMPDKGLIDALEKAKPETYVFYPSLYAPDGISHADKAWLRQRIAQRLHMQLQDEMQRRDTLPMQSATIGEMMLANREKSLVGNVLQKGLVDNLLPPDGNAEQRMLHCLVLLDDARNEGGTTGRQEASGVKQRELPPKLLEEVVRIGNRVKASANVREARIELQQKNVEL